MDLLNNDIINLVQSIKKYYNLKEEHESNDQLNKLFLSEQPKHVVLMCLDGLGTCLLDKAPFLQSNLFQNINTVFPPTTACATISLQTGLYPYEHGWIGWAQYFKEYDAVLELFSGVDFYSGDKYDYEKVIKDIQFKQFFNEINNSKEFFPSFHPNGYCTFKDMLEGVTKHINSKQTTFSYVYWSQPDTILHEEGSNSINTINIIQEIDNLIKDFSKGLSNTMIIITADHGHIDCEPIKLSSYPRLVECISKKPSIEARCSNLFIHKDKENIFLEEVKPLLKYFDLYTKEEFIVKHLSKNKKVHFKINEFLGDFILVGKDKYYLSDDINHDIKKDFKSAHAGYTSLEMEVPLIIIK